jgi:hypothetical protein
MTRVLICRILMAMSFRDPQGSHQPEAPAAQRPTAEQSLAVYRALALSDVTDEYEAAMRHFPVR